MRRRQLLSAIIGPIIVAKCNAESPEELVLQPATHWTVSTADMWHLQARHDHSLYYAEDGQADQHREHLYGSTSVQYVLPAVNLNHSEHIQLDVRRHQVSIAFKDPVAFEHAYTWKSHPELLFLAHPSSCSKQASKDYCYLSARGLRYDNTSLALTASVKRLHPDQCIRHAAFEWGVHKPPTPAPLMTGLGQLPNLEGAGSALDLTDAEELARSQDKTEHHFAARVKRDDEDPEAEDWLHWDPKKIPGINQPVGKQFRKAFEWNVPKNRGTDDSPWGKARRLRGPGSIIGRPAKGVASVYCVDCGAAGSMVISGKGAWSATHGLTEGSVSLLTNMNIGFALGFDTSGNRTQTINIPLGTHGFPCITFGIVAVGPMISLAADIRLTSNGGGNMLTGARVMIANGLMTLDLADPAKSASAGWKPEFVPVLETQGDTNMGVEVGLPIGISVGVSILEGRYSKTAGVVERPALEAKAESRENGAALVTTDGCNGVSTQINFKNELYAQVLGDKYGLLHPYARTLTKGCLSKHQRPAKRPIAPTLQAFNTTAPFERTYAPLLDTTKTYALASCPDGGVHLLPPSAPGFFARTFALADAAVVADGFARTLTYDGTSMRRLGVSRVQAFDAGAVPTGAQSVTLVPGSDALLDARTAAGQVFRLLLCTYKHDPATVFLLKDGVDWRILETDRAEDVARGTIRGCWALPLQVGGQKADWDGAWDVDQGYEGAEQGRWLDEQEWFR